MAFPLNGALPWKLRIPQVDVPYWPGRAVRFGGDESWRFPDWETRLEFEYLTGRDYEISLPGAVPTLPYRADISSWSALAKMRLDLPVTRPINAMFGRIPWLEPLTVFGSFGAGFASTQVAISDSIIFGDDEVQGLALQYGAGVGYRMSERFHLTIGWRYNDFGTASTALNDGTIDRGSIDLDLTAQEISTEVRFDFWRVPFLGHE